jgi:class 3 adenylate cyclase
MAVDHPVTMAIRMLRRHEVSFTPHLYTWEPRGGTRASAERWTQKVGTPIVVDLRQIRDDAMPRATADTHASARADTDASARADTEYDTVAPIMPPRIVAERPRRTIKTMLFADVAGYSRLHDAFAPMFQQRFLEIGAKLIDGSVRKPLEAKTWGDAVYAVFELPRDGAEFALRFLERMLAVDWTAAGLSGASQVRIALHAGPVFRIHDPITRADGHFGSAVTRAARIEPVTPPGMIYASEAFAAALASTGEREFRTEYVGTLALAKGYGDSRIYRLDRCH